MKELSNKELIESAFKQIEEETGFHIIDIEYGDSYGIADGEEDSICHFHIKEIPKFIFAFWNTNRFDKPTEDDGFHIRYKCSPSCELLFFTQYERDVDKFKPSYSGFTQGIFRYEYKEDDKDWETVWEMFDLIDTLKFMKKHFFKSYVYVGAQLNHIWDEQSGFKCFTNYMKSSYYHYKYRLKDYIKRCRCIRAAKSFCHKLRACDYIITYDKYSSPCIDIKFSRRADFCDGDVELDVIMYEQFHDKWFNEISIYPMFADIISGDSGMEEIDADANLRNLFYDNIKEIEGILKSKPNEDLQDDLGFTKVIEMKVK